MKEQAFTVSIPVVLESKLKKYCQAFCVTAFTTKQPWQADLW
jgi:hypothetical protein